MKRQLHKKCGVFEVCKKVADFFDTLGNGLARSAMSALNLTLNAEKTARMFKSRLSFVICSVFLIWCKRNRQVFSEALPRYTNTVIAVSRPAAASKTTTGGTGKPVPYEQ